MSTGSTYQRLNLLDLVLLCKEFPLPTGTNVHSIRIVHRMGFFGAYCNDNHGLGKEMRIYVHMAGTFLLSQFLAEISKDVLFDCDSLTTNLILKMENFHLSQEIVCMAKEQSYDACIINEAYRFLNETLGCSLALDR